MHKNHLRHARAARRLPGFGGLDVVALVRAVQDVGFAEPWCIEVNTPASRELPVGEAARTAADAALRVLDAARR